MTIQRFSFKDIDSLFIAKRDLCNYYPTLGVAANRDSLELLVESKNSVVFDSRIVSLISNCGGELIKE